MVFTRKLNLLASVIMEYHNAEVKFCREAIDECEKSLYILTTKELSLLREVKKLKEERYLLEMAIKSRHQQIDDLASRYNSMKHINIKLLNDEQTTEHNLSCLEEQFTVMDISGSFFHNGKLISQQESLTDQGVKDGDTILFAMHTR